MDLDGDAKPKAALLNAGQNDMALSDDADFDYRDAGEPAADATGTDAKTPIKRRAPVACRRCRRMRSKCIHDRATPPCKACDEAGLGAADCIFPARGQPDNDREYRHPRRRADKFAKRDLHKLRREVLDAPIVRQPGAPARPKHADQWDLLPPLPDIIEAVRLFTSQYFQLGFIPKELFPRQLERDHRSVPVFLLLGILSISARFSPNLAQRYDGEIKAVDYFMDKASALALNELYQEPTLERCQAFYLLSLAQQGSGYRTRSYINLGVATRMAVLMYLHREESYKPQNASKEVIIRQESARRTLWMLHSQDNLHSGAMSPISLAANDITCLLPSNEKDFCDGRLPEARAALEDTPPAKENPALIHQPSRSLFASLIQAHYYWGRVARRAIVATNKSKDPWDPSSDFAIMADKLANWEQRLPSDHRWSSVLLRGHKTACEDLAYMNVTMMSKLCHVVLRRQYLEEMINPDPKDRNGRAFFSQMADDLFRNVRELYEQIDAQFASRSSNESVGAQMASFCVYSCGLFSTYLCKYKHICSSKWIVRQGPNMLQRCMSILIESKEVWPLASRWLESLERFSRDPKAAAIGLDGGMADGNDRALRPLHVVTSPSFASPHGKKPSLTHLSSPATPNEDSKHNVFPPPGNTSPSISHSPSVSRATSPSVPASAEGPRLAYQGQGHRQASNHRQTQRQQQSQQLQYHARSQAFSLPQPYQALQPPQPSPTAPETQAFSQQQQMHRYQRQHPQQQVDPTMYAHRDLSYTAQNLAGVLDEAATYNQAAPSKHQHQPLGQHVPPKAYTHSESFQSHFFQPPLHQNHPYPHVTPVPVCNVPQLNQPSPLPPPPPPQTQPQPQPQHMPENHPQTTTPYDAANPNPIPNSTPNPNPVPLFTSPTTALGPGTDGFQDELKTLFDSPNPGFNWAAVGFSGVGMGTGMGMGYMMG